MELLLVLGLGDKGPQLAKLLVASLPEREVKPAAHAQLVQIVIQGLFWDAHFTRSVFERVADEHDDVTGVVRAGDARVEAPPESHDLNDLSDVTLSHSRLLFNFSRFFVICCGTIIIGSLLLLELDHDFVTLLGKILNRFLLRFANFWLQFNFDWLWQCLCRSYGHYIFHFNCFLHCTVIFFDLKGLLL